jgi:hypothetical protein
MILPLLFALPITGLFLGSSKIFQTLLGSDGRFQDYSRLRNNFRCLIALSFSGGKIYFFGFDHRKID